MAVGSAVVDFGATPTDKASVAVIGQGTILANSKCEAYLDPTLGATAEHSVDEHIMAAALVDVTCAAIVAGTGFTIYAVCPSLMAGSFNVSWVWV